MALTEVRQEFVEPFMEGLSMVSSAWQAGYTIRRDDVASWKMASMSGIGAVPQWDGSNDVTTADINDRYNTTVAYTKYALQARINKYDRKDLPGITQDAGVKLGISAMSTYATVAAGLLNNAFGTTQAGDGVALCSDSHPTSTGLRDNAMTSAFDRTCYFAARSLARNWPSYHGIPENWADDGFHVYGSSQDATLEETFAEVFGSVYSSSEMQVNAAAGLNATPQLWEYLTDPTRAFFVSKRRSPLVFWIRSGVETNVNIDQDNLNDKITIDFAIGVQVRPDPVGIIGTDS
jgi:hypothetical protein